MSKSYTVAAVEFFGSSDGIYASNCPQIFCTRKTRPKRAVLFQRKRNKTARLTWHVSTFVAAAACLRFASPPFGRLRRRATRRHLQPPKKRAFPTPKTAHFPAGNPFTDIVTRFMRLAIAHRRFSQNFTEKFADRNAHCRRRRGTEANRRLEALECDGNGKKAHRCCEKAVFCRRFLDLGDKVGRSSVYAGEF